MALLTLRLLLMSMLLVALGWPLVRRTALDFFGSIALAWTVGLAAVTITVSMLAHLGVPVRRVTILMSILVLAALAWSALRVTVPRQRHVVRSSWSAALALAVFALDVWKIVSVPLWSWDHFAIWGAKARILASTHALSAMGRALHPEYPVGFPVAVEVLNAGAVSNAFAFRITHLAFLAITLLLVRTLVMGSTRDVVAANLSVAIVALLPLAWDTEGLGLADIAIAGVATAASVELIAERPSWVVLGVCVGFLPWLKQEGLTLALFLILTAALLHNRHEFAREAGLALCLGIAALLVPVGEGVSFFAGEWYARVLARAQHPGLVLAPLWPYLVAPATLGVWALIPVGVVVAVLRRERRALVLLLVVCAQCAVYVCAYFATYLDPSDHIRSSFPRIATALSPLAVGALALAILPRTNRADGYH